MWLGQYGETKAPIPDALFKIVIKIRKDSSQIDTLAFLLPNILPKAEKDFGRFLTSIDRLEALTGLDFLTSLDDDIGNEVEVTVADSVDW